ncbi:hypothetical protein F5Y00DRAFT_272799 [Daldinia vernicosa]|uniref:uncharacterized protein n=1 Tax=Daldinia vernicosa TaxID=114800 RepID=UPI0020086CF6|nr:uncharacterized protein F5Y00DRAFT_272799 [Daldinia vernicosa]KAI0845610.1 hypothetical protein F5Y00DRAFT_272799 [Daldinia vernicosa]
MALRFTYARRVLTRRGSGPLPFGTAYRGRRPAMSATIARHMVRSFSHMLNPRRRRSSSQDMLLYLIAQEGLGLSPDRWDFIIDAIRNTSKPDPDRMEGLEFTGLLTTNDKLDIDGDIVMTDAIRNISKPDPDRMEGLEFTGPDRMEGIEFTGPDRMEGIEFTGPDRMEGIEFTGLMDTDGDTVMTDSPLFLPTIDHPLENTNEYTTPIKTRQLFGLEQLSLVGLHTKRKLEKEADSSSEEAKQPRRKITKVTKRPSLDRKEFLSVPKANGLVRRPSLVHHRRSLSHSLRLRIPDGNVVVDLDRRTRVWRPGYVDRIMMVRTRSKDGYTC